MKFALHKLNKFWCIFFTMITFKITDDISNSNFSTFYKSYLEIVSDESEYVERIRSDVYNIYLNINRIE